MKGGTVTLFIDEGNLESFTSKWVADHFGPRCDSKATWKIHCHQLNLKPGYLQGIPEVWDTQEPGRVPAGEETAEVPDRLQVKGGKLDSPCAPAAAPTAPETPGLLKPEES